jgi:hypothetical protein
MVEVVDWVWVIVISCIACVGGLVSWGWGFLFGFHSWQLKPEGTNGLLWFIGNKEILD